jgi:NAD(P)-dependent dehydrogenase (short-subunit alcohol dehydrogenase family)
VRTADPVLDLFRLDGRTAVVTGGSTGLGVEFARTLARAGARLVLVARRAERLDQVRDALIADGHDAVAVAGDVAEPAVADRTVAAAMERFGRVDVLVNNAGIASAVPATRETPEQFRAILDVNLEGAYWMAQACGRVMRPGSSIVNISSILALKPARLPHAAYAASKAGLLALTRDLASQWTRRKGIRVNAIAPGYFDTDINAGFDRGYVEQLRSQMLIDRFGRVEELCSVMLLLASDAGGYMTGTTVVVDGGLRLH